MTDYAAQIAEARKHGYSDDQIVQYLGQSDKNVSEALSAGHSAGDIVKYLSESTETTTPPDQKFQRKPASWGEVIAGAAPRAAAGLTDVILNTPENLINLGKMAYGTAVTAAGRPELAPEVTAPQARITTAAREANVPGFMTGKDLTTAQRIVDVGLQGAALAPVGGTTNLLRNVALGGISGATGQATTEATGSPLAGLTASIATPAVLSSLQRTATVAANRNVQAQAEELARRQATNIVKDKIWEDSRKAGFVVPKSAVEPTTFTSATERAVGQSALTQRSQLKNQEVVNNLVRKELGLSQDTPLTEELFSKMRTVEAEAYNRIKNLPLQQVQTAELDAAGLPKTVQLNPKKIVEDLQQSRTDARDFWEAYKRDRSPATRAKAVEADAKSTKLEDQIDQVVDAANKPKFADELRKARTQIAKLHAIEDSFNPASQNVDPNYIARLADKGVPLTGNLKTIADFSRAFPRYVKETSKLASPAADTSDSAAALFFHALKAPAAAAASLLRAPTRAAMTSEWFQNALVRPNYTPNSLLTGAQQILNRTPSIPNIYTPATLAVGQNALANRGQQ